MLCLSISGIPFFQLARNQRLARVFHTMLDRVCAPVCASTHQKHAPALMVNERMQRRIA